MPIIQSVDRALQILDLFDEYTTELKITEISELMNLHKSTVHSLLKTLQKKGYIRQNEENGKYALGMKLFERGNYIIQSLDIRQVAKKYLLDLSLATGQTTHLAIMDGKEGVYMDKMEGSKAVILYSRIGRRISLHCSAVGKALIAFNPSEDIKKLLKDYVYYKQTENTITNEVDFMGELEKVRNEGYSIDDQENEPGVRCVAVPIRNYKNQVIAAISISTLAASVDDHQLNEFIEMLKQACSEISEQMGYGTPVRT
ncbi:IclR family transcriptional regulator [Metabacillus sp. RGM 3146]|uniref:IclR family transcriptional regulator n=1 Tax=Metabacillus sp. RGM 3146 TaxID=3401092 RepID=UPI003B99D530